MSSGQRPAATGVSPLKQVNVAVSELKPKATKLYEQLFAESVHPPGFWVEFFLLPVNSEALNTQLAKPSKAQLLDSPMVLQTLVRASVVNINSPDSYIVENSLRILAVVIHHLAMERSLTSDELLTLIAGIDRASDILDSLTDSVLRLMRDKNIRLSTRIAALRFVLIVTASSAQTSLAPILTQKNFFSAFTGMVDSAYRDSIDEKAELSFLAIGVLGTLGKFDDGVDVYRQRISEYIDETVLDKMIDIVHEPLLEVVEEYRVAVSPENKSAQTPSALPKWMSSFWKPAAEATGTAPKNVRISTPLVCYLLPLYEFVIHNELFAAKLSADAETFAVLIKLGTHLLSNSHKDPSARAYGWLLSTVMRKLIEDEQCFKTLVDTSIVLPISHQREPALAKEPQKRPLLAGVFDLVQCGLRFNVGKNMDNTLYELLLTILHQALSELSSSRFSMFPYNWPQMWHTLWSITKYYQASPLLLEVIAGAVLRRDLFDEDDWEALYMRTVQPREPLVESPSTSGWAFTVLTALKAEFELLSGQDPEKDYTQQVLKRGVNAARGHKPLAPRKFFVESEQLRFLRRTARVAFVDVIRVAQPPDESFGKDS